MRKILAPGAFFVLALALSACGSSVSGNAVANVAGNPITETAFNHWMYIAAKGNAAQSPGAPVIVPTDPPDFKGCIVQVRRQIPSLAKTSDKQIKSDCAQLFTSLSSTVMDFLVKAYWYQADANKHHISISDAQVQAAFNVDRKQQFPTTAAFQTFLTQSGQTMQDILFRVRVNLVYKALLARHSTTVTPARIQAYYSTHQQEFGTPETRDIRIVRTNSQKQAQAAKAALSSGQSWNTVAKKFSVDTATKNHGGQLAGVTRGQEEAALDTAAFGAPLNKLGGPLHGTFGWYVYEVTKIKPAATRSLAQATPLIRQILGGQTQTSAQHAVDAQAKLDFLHQTTCRSAFAMADCNGYKAPKTSTTTTPTPTPTPAPSTTTG